MITKEEAENLGFVDMKDCRAEFSLRLRIDDFFIVCANDWGLNLNEAEREQGIDISHLNPEQVKTLISLLTKPKV